MVGSLTGQQFSSLLQRPRRLLSDEYQDLSPERGANHSLPSCANIKNVFSYNFIPHLRLNGIMFNKPQKYLGINLAYDTNVRIIKIIIRI